MAITVKNEKQIEYMRIAGRITGEALNLMGAEVREGVYKKQRGYSFL